MKPRERRQPKRDRWCWRAARALLALALVPADAAMAPGDEVLFDPQTGYRIAHYRSPVPDTVDGGTRVVAADVERLVAEKHAVLIDAMPSEGGRADPDTGEWHMLVPHFNIAGSAWLPDVGKGDLAPAFEIYFKTNLERLTAGNKQTPVVFYCVSDCWMSWNAVKRAASYGYASLYWLADGTDGWRDWGGKLVPAEPERFTTGR